ncbi:MAG: alpha-amylase family glycosyl hydrolase [Candidatus Hodarchaeales archaeon]
MVDISDDLKQRIISKLRILYNIRAETIFNELKEILNDFEKNLHREMGRKQLSLKQEKKIGYKDIILSIYADSIQEEHKTPLQVLYQFSKQYLEGKINGIHVLPFYSWDTDRGFSVLNYYEIDRRNGNWKDFMRLKEVFDKLMVDCVLNHASIDNPIVQKSLIGNVEFKDFVIAFKDEEKPTSEELLKIARARPTPVLTRYYMIADENNKRWVTFNRPSQRIDSKEIKIEDTGWVWTTFSRPNNPDGTVATKQVDLNYTNPNMFLELIRIMLFYISKGANWLRLDAIGYIWKKIGTTCLHLPETHTFIQLINDVFKVLEHLQIVLIGEINEPQEKALQYLTNDEEDECDMVYLFTHYPLAVHAVLTGTSKYYMDWIPSLIDAQGKLLISVLGTHDGMGMKPIGKWLPKDEKRKLQGILIEKHGTLANFAYVPGGEKIIYELCSTPWNFINQNETNDPLTLQIDRYLAVFALGLMIKGVPSIYINGLLGIPNFRGELDENRSINRQILSKNYIDKELNNKNSKMYNIFSEMMHLIKIRTEEKSFDPAGQMKVYPINDAVISVLLSSSDDCDKIFALVNVSDRSQVVRIDIKIFESQNGDYCRDIVSGIDYEINNVTKDLQMSLNPYQICWLKRINKQNLN